MVIIRYVILIIEDLQGIIVLWLCLQEMPMFLTSLSSHLNRIATIFTTSISIFPAFFAEKVR